MEELLDRILALLRQAGIRCEAAWPARTAPQLAAPMTTARIERAELKEAGIGGWLGLLDDPKTGLREIRGRTLEATALLRVASPARLGGQACFREACRVMDALLAGADGLAIGPCTLEENRYDRASGLFLTEIRAGLRVHVTPAVPAEEIFEIEDFNLKGEIV